MTGSSVVYQLPPEHKIRGFFVMLASPPDEEKSLLERVRDWVQAHLQPGHDHVREKPKKPLRPVAQPL